MNHTDIIDLGWWDPGPKGKWQYVDAEQFKTEINKRSAKNSQYRYWRGFAEVIFSTNTIHESAMVWHRDGDSLERNDFYLCMWANRWPTRVRDMQENEIVLRANHIYLIPNHLYKHLAPDTDRELVRQHRVFIRWWAERIFK